MARRKLSHRQIERIRRIQERRLRKLSEPMDRDSDEFSDDALHEGLVVARHGGNLAIADSRGRVHQCLTRQNIGHLVCGDWVAWQRTGNAQGVILALQERQSVLTRPDYSGREKPLAANITQLVLVVAPRPEPTEYLIDQYLVAAEHIGVTATIALNKMDLVHGEQEQAFLERFAHYQQIGYPVAPVSACREHGLDRLFAALKDHTSILVGQSGVGKSSLIDALLPDLDIQIGRLSEATGLGRHTTSAATWYRLPAGGALIDSPGVRSFRLVRLASTELAHGFREFRPQIGHCRFVDCRHDHEPGCAIKAAVHRGEIHAARLENFLHMAAQLCGPPG